MTKSDIYISVCGDPSKLTDEMVESLRKEFDDFYRGFRPVTPEEEDNIRKYNQGGNE